MDRGTAACPELAEVEIPFSAGGAAEISNVIIDPIIV
jgi:hypothetical protein